MSRRTQDSVRFKHRLRLLLLGLTSHSAATRRFILQKARHHPLTGSDFLQAYGFRFSFTPLARFFSPFPHGTCSLSLTHLYLALADGPACFQQDSSCPVVLRIPFALNTVFAYRAFTCSGFAFHRIQLTCSPLCTVLQPHVSLQPQVSMVWASSRSLAATWEIPFCFLFLRLLRCFSSPGSSSFQSDWP